MFRIFSHSTPVHFSWNCESGPKLRKSFIYHLCMPWCPTSKTDLTLECQTCQTCLMKEFERKLLCVLGILRPMNMETNWMFPTDISRPTHHATGEACWRKSTSLSWYLATHLQPGKEYCCLLRCPTPSLDLDQLEYQPWCEAKWSMCIMPLPGANN